MGVEERDVASQGVIVHAQIENQQESCRREEADLKAWQQGNNTQGTRRETDEHLSEPLFACLFGIPGAGKSTCIRHSRSFFIEALGWEDGVDSQFLATQNTMAALIRGNTVHHWGSIPVNAAIAQEKAYGKRNEGDVDALFERVLGCRWLVIDETSTASLTQLGTLDSYLRRACSRHPYARRGGHQYPFGGINVIFAGDLWQLPPVKGKAIFSDPFHGGLTAAEFLVVAQKKMIDLLVAESAST